MAKMIGKSNLTVITIVTIILLLAGGLFSCSSAESKPKNPESNSEVNGDKVTETSSKAEEEAIARIEAVLRFYRNQLTNRSYVCCLTGYLPPPE